MDAMSSAPLVSHVLPGAQRAVAWWGSRDLAGPGAGAPYWWSVLAAVILLVLTIWLLRRRPLWALGLLLACAGAASLASPQWQIALFPAVQRGPLPSSSELLVLLLGTTIGVIAATRPRRISVGAVGVTVGLLTGCLVRQTPHFGLEAGPRGGDRHRLADRQLDQAEPHDAEALRAQAEAQAATAERLRIARELHDMVAHSIGIIAIQAGAGAGSSAPSPPRRITPWPPSRPPAGTPSRDCGGCWAPCAGPIPAMSQARHRWTRRPAWPT